MTVRTTDIEIIAEYLNDAEINFLADLFLACFDLDRSTRGYRRLRNAVILISHSVGNVRDVSVAVARLECSTPEAVLIDLRNTVTQLPRAAHITFNEYYSPPVCADGHPPLSLCMPPFSDPDDVILFLGTVFLYIGFTNYNSL